MNRLIIGLAALALAGCEANDVNASDAAATENACAALAGLDITNTNIISAAEKPAGPFNVGAGPASTSVALPAHCYVEGISNQRTGADGKTYGLGFALAMPADWNGRFLFQGGGGLNGTVHPPLGGNAAGDTPALARGFAVISTDGGHKGQGGFDASFMADQQAALDFTGQSVAKVTELGKEIVKTYYGQAAHHTYISGCSTGGRESMLAAQRYPMLFDGAVVGAPAMRTGNSNFALRKAVVAFNQVAPLDDEGNPQVSRAFSPAERRAVHDGLLAQCDALDGLADGVVANVRGCDFDPNLLVCDDNDTDSCLSQAQANAIDEAFAPLVNSAGFEIYPAFPVDTGMIEGGMTYIPGDNFFSPGASAKQIEIDIDAEDAQLRNDPMQARTDSYRWTNFSTFLNRGGKIVFYHGVSDAWFSAYDTLGFYQRASDANEGWSDASRYYHVPGMGHCAGGANTYDSFDLLSAVVDWVENGQAPRDVIASRTKPEPASRKLCAYPEHPHYTGGDATSADSYECR
ncbi:DUF6351 family protein [Alteromonas gilva]|uniref:DUF6351 family protein n=1 Tax=Alteromonas gilva TaxID=2987522 RepID=A0ABT5KXY2_9ALTE|nr:DUF6351 family protein [Alteromonas gilva]MDC8829630.1 DUF6351 family protein [Alteromonas gilva]